MLTIYIIYKENTPPPKKNAHEPTIYRELMLIKVYQFAKATIIKYYILSGLHIRNVFILIVLEAGILGQSVGMVVSLETFLLGF